MADTNGYDRESELKAFDDSKAGVKGLVDAGITKVPRFFIQDKPTVEEKSSSSLDSSQASSIPVIDLAGIHGDNSDSDRSGVVEKIRVASEKWGFFQIINHGIPLNVLDEMIQGVRNFHELDVELKKGYYSRQFFKKFVYISNFQLFKGDAALWSDSIACAMVPNPPLPQELPSVCRDIFAEYSKYIMKLGLTLLELLSEALGLEPNHLKDIGCCEGLFFLGHYYPSCPEPDKALGAHAHTDASFFTILLQDLLGGLQVRYEDRWINVSPLPGALIVNIADLLQLITNDKFKSAYHRVIAQKVGPRVSVAAFFRTFFEEGSKSKSYAPIKELISKETPAIYRETTFQEYLTSRVSGEGVDGPPTLSNFKIASVDI